MKFTQYDTGYLFGVIAMLVVTICTSAFGAWGFLSIIPIVILIGYGRKVACTRPPEVEDKQETL